MDTLSQAERSQRMSLVSGKDTKPEMLVRRTLHRLGYRYRLHSKDLPGKPDIVFRSRQKVIFVHGCFWHRHPSRKCKLARMPKSRLEFWKPKLDQNRQRDIKNQRALSKMGWKYLILWECELNDETGLARRLTNFLSEGSVSTNA